MKTWERNLSIICVGLFFSSAGLSAVVPFLPLFIRDLGVTEVSDTAFWSGLVFAGPFIISFFTTSIWGSLGDKYGRKLMTLRAIFGLSIAMMLTSTAQNEYQLFLFRLLQGALSGFYPAAIGLIGANTPKEKVGYALGLTQSAYTAGNIFGPLIGGLISNVLGFRNVFLVIGALIFLVGIVTFFLMKEETKPAPNEPRHNFLDNWKYLFTNKILLRVSLLILLTSFGVQLISPIFVLYIETFSIDEKSLPLVTGVLFSILGIFSTISAAWLGSRIDKTGIRKNLLIATAITSVMYLLHAIVENIYLLIPIRILLGLGYGLIIPLLFTAISKNSESNRKGGLISIGSSFQILGNMLGPISSGIIVGYFGLNFSFVLASIIFVIVFLLTYRTKSFTTYLQN